MGQVVVTARSHRIRRLRRVDGFAPPQGCESFLAILEGPADFQRHALVKQARRDDPESAAALGREARVYARLDHPAIPQVFDFYQESDRLTLVLQWIDGLGLDVVVERARARGVRMPIAAVAQIGVMLFSALDAAHNARDPQTREFAPVVHQGIGPAAILLTSEGRLRLGDFGGSRTLAALDLTPAGLLGMHEGYLAPEQVLGDRPSVRTDIYSACIVLRELLTGAPAFPRDDGDYLAWLEQIAHPSLSDVSLSVKGLDPSFSWLLRVGLRPERDARSVTAAIAVQVLTPIAAAGRGDVALIDFLDLLGAPPVAPPVAEPPETWPPSAPTEPQLSVADSDDEIPTVAIRRWPAAAGSTPPPASALDQNRTPAPMMRALATAPTLPSLRRRDRTSWWLAAAALTVLGIGWAVLRKHASQPLEAPPAPASMLIAPEPAPSTSTTAAAAISAKPSTGELRGATIATAEEITKLLADAGESETFVRCFSSDERPRDGRTLRTRCAGGPTLTLLVVALPGKPPHRIAAFTAAPLEMSTVWRSDPRAFLASLEPYRIHRVRVEKFALDNRNGTFGPSLGGGHDLHVGPSLTNGFTVPKSFLTRQDTDFIGGFGPFRIDRIEVFVSQNSALTTDSEGSKQ
ncbi:MAG: serine/threonine protein kinase [Polyangiales bacterium]